MAEQGIDNVIPERQHLYSPGILNGFFLLSRSIVFFFFNDTATTEIYTLSLHDALPIWAPASSSRRASSHRPCWKRVIPRSEEHTSELQSRRDLVCRLLLEKKKNK